MPLPGRAVARSITGNPPPTILISLPSFQNAFTPPPPLPLLSCPFLPMQQDRMDPWAALRQILEHPLPEKSMLMRSLSCNDFRQADRISPSFDVFGQIQFTGKQPSPGISFLPNLLPSMTPIEGDKAKPGDRYDLGSNGLPPNNADPLCIEDAIKGSTKNPSTQRRKEDRDTAGRAPTVHNGQKLYPRSNSDVRFTRTEAFPPPISTIGRCVKPWVYLKSFKKDGRLVLKKIEVPTQQCMQPTRENGRLLLIVPRPIRGIGKREEKGENVEEEEEEEEKREEIQSDKRKKD